MSPAHSYTLTLHDALPICYLNCEFHGGRFKVDQPFEMRNCEIYANKDTLQTFISLQSVETGGDMFRSEEHTSELQSRFDLVCRLLLEKKNIIYITLFL